MQRFALSLAAAALAPALIAVPANAAEVSIAATGPVVELQVSQQVLGDPDKATISAGVTTRAQTAVAAMQQNAVEMDRVLKRMLRRYTRGLYLERIAKLREAVPALTLSTDVIVGFPGETDEDFEETLSLVRAAGFTAAFAFKYSPRPFTPALKLGDDVPEAVKDERLQRLFAVVGEQQRAHLDGLVGSRQRVLVEGPSRDGVRFQGRTHRNEIVHIAGPEGVDLTGQLVDVTIEHANNHSLMGLAEGVVPAAPAPRRKRLPVLGGAAGGAA